MKSAKLMKQKMIKKKEIYPFFIVEKQYKAVDVPDQYKTNKICDKILSKNLKH